MSTRADVGDAGGAAPSMTARVVKDFGELLGRAFVLALALGLVLTLAGVALPAPAAGGGAGWSLRLERMPSGQLPDAARERGEAWTQAPKLSPPR